MIQRIKINLDAVESSLFWQATADKEKLMNGLLMMSRHGVISIFTMKSLQKSLA